LFPLLYLLAVPHKRNPFLRFHCFQCLALFSLLLPWAFVSILDVSWAKPAMAFMPPVVFVGWLVSMVQAGRGKMFRLPLLGPVADWLSR
jgi:uncharacterized membrane protein